MADTTQHPSQRIDEHIKRLGGNVRRAIDIKEDETIDKPALEQLVRAAVAFNGGA